MDSEVLTNRPIFALEFFPAVIVDFFPAHSSYIRRGQGDVISAGLQGQDVLHPKAGRQAEMSSCKMAGSARCGDRWRGCPENPLSPEWRSAGRRYSCL